MKDGKMSFFAFPKFEPREEVLPAISDITESSRLHPADDAPSHEDAISSSGLSWARNTMRATDVVTSNRSSKYTDAQAAQLRTHLPVCLVRKVKVVLSEPPSRAGSRPSLTKI